MANDPSANSGANKFKLYWAAGTEGREIAQSCLVGRTEGEIMIGKDDLLSSKHAQFSVVNDTLYLRDLNSSNGTFKNGARVPAMALIELVNGDEIKIGAQIFKVEALLGSTKSAATVISAPSTAPEKTRIESVPLPIESTQSESVKLVAIAAELTHVELPDPVVPGNSERTHVEAMEHTHVEASASDANSNHDPQSQAGAKTQLKIKMAQLPGTAIDVENVHGQTKVNARVAAFTALEVAGEALEEKKKSSTVPIYMQTGYIVVGALCIGVALFFIFSMRKPAAEAPQRSEAAVSEPASKSGVLETPASPATAQVEMPPVETAKAPAAAPVTPSAPLAPSAIVTPERPMIDYGANYSAKRAKEAAAEPVTAEPSAPAETAAAMAPVAPVAQPKPAKSSTKKVSQRFNESKLLAKLSGLKADYLRTKSTRARQGLEIDAQEAIDNHYSQLVANVKKKWKNSRGLASQQKDVLKKHLISEIKLMKKHDEYAKAHLSNFLLGKSKSPLP